MSTVVPQSQFTVQSYAQDIDIHRNYSFILTSFSKRKSTAMVSIYLSNRDSPPYKSIYLPFSTMVSLLTYHGLSLLMKAALHTYQTRHIYILTKGFLLSEPCSLDQHRKTSDLPSTETSDVLQINPVKKEEK